MMLEYHFYEFLEKYVKNTTNIGTSKNKHSKINACLKRIFMNLNIDLKRKIKLFFFNIDQLPCL